MLTAGVENMLVISIVTTMETGVVPTQYIVIISTVSSVGSTLFQLLISAWAALAESHTACVNTFSFLLRKKEKYVLTGLATCLSLLCDIFDLPISKILHFNTYFISQKFWLKNAILDLQKCFRNQNIKYPSCQKMSQ